eukprot:CAMPEP_0177370112 /NCGR_PEP_ID=MMETSP0368-20130122/41809_1 /TAXON_ID=447022 ORGANISM="Scrippsiella hangoei-like, Strain SHHI-4" /NCGR_SAMPLE_ID=MMETSP0368 /ASSEMBLY_ACC=CAM_ASM_000363 /LENGTH=559 /DNA_ID=CAMNT_0018833337 /DNA_START=65 /DNA_END=1744 /DNA_ORIENTATION=+
MSKTVVVASGYFNPLHFGHVSFLQKAKDAGTHLIVIVNNDAQAERRRVGLPGISMPARDRVRLVRSLACVDAAMEAVDEDDSVADTLRMLHPDLFANGGKQVATEKEAAVCAELGITLLVGLGIEMLLLQPFTQHYEWGKKRGESAVALLAGESEWSPGSLSSPNGSRPYAELWMGDHPSGPSKVRTPNGAMTGCLISTLKRSPSVLGEKLAQDGTLPFLMKVLSIEKALSIQAHPDRELAARLHRDRPDVYKDANHKPEIAIALTAFEALCGFRQVSELHAFVVAVPELRSAVGEAAVAALQGAVTSGELAEEEAAIRLAYCTMMRTPEAEIERLVPEMVAQDAPEAENGHSAALAKAYNIVKKCNKQFGNDIGLFSIFFLNYVEMSVGDCLYMAQNIPHAYLSGDIVECMACSDNVVRGGLTPKYKDIDVLCEMLVYKGGLPPCIAPCPVGDMTWLYAHKDLEEFQVTKMLLLAGKARRFCFSAQGPTLGFVFSGAGLLKISDETTKLVAGVVFLLSAGVDCDVIAVDDLHCYVACCPPQYFNPPARKDLMKAFPHA